MIFTLPLALFELVFGSGRLQFVLALLYIYLTAFLFSLAALVSLAMPDKRQAFWSTVFAGLAIPVVWAPSLRGYPDMAPAAALALAAYLYLQAKNRRRLITVGILCALAPLLRRHFAYGAIALAMVILVDQLRAPLKAAEKIKNLFAMAFSAILFMVAFGSLFIVNVLSCDYSALYKSFAVPFVEALGYFGSTYGAVLFATASGGAIWACLDNDSNKRNLYFILAFSVFTMVVWMVTQRQLGAHYTLYFDWFVICGNALLVYRLIQNARAKAVFRPALAGLVIFFVVNFALAYSSRAPMQSTRPGMLSKPLREGTPVSYLFSANYAPYLRGDKEQVIALARTLRALSDNNKDCLVLINAQSDLLDVDIVRNAERAACGDSRIAMSEVPATDSRDSYPLEVLLHSRFVVTTEPDQTLLSADRQKIILCVNRCFAENWPLAKAFKKLPQQFVLDGGVKASIYERTRPTLPLEAAQTLDQMHDYIGLIPGSQPAWITTGVQSPVSYAASTSTYKFKSGGPTHYFLLSSKPLETPQGRPVRVSGKLTSAGGDVRVWVIALCPQNALPGPVTSSLVQSGKTFEALCPMSGQSSSGRLHLVLLVTAADNRHDFAISDLKIAR